MKKITLESVIEEQMKDKAFSDSYSRELLINAIAKLVTKVRTSKELTQSQLATRVGTTQSVISRLESGSTNRVPSLDLLSRVASATNTKINISFEADQ